MVKFAPPQKPQKYFFYLCMYGDCVFCKYSVMYVFCLENGKGESMVWKAYQTWLSFWELQIWWMIGIQEM